MFKKDKKIGTGAYGKVYQVTHTESGEKFAIKRFEGLFIKELRVQRLLREMTILEKITHPCLNKCVAVLPPENIENFNEVYMVLDLCDMDMRKLLKSSKHLDEE